MSHQILGCRSCGEANLAPVLDLGRTPLANALLSAGQPDGPEPTYPLELVLCPSCSLVQITETVPPEILFRDYVYFSSFSDTMVAHAKELATHLITERALSSESLVVEAASNDGYLLQHYRQAGIGVLGIEPAANVAQVAIEKRDVPTLVDFFGADLASRLAAEGRKADVFHAHNVLAHVADLNGFVAGIRALLKDTGIALIEVPYIKNLIDHLEFDTIYHEHLCYFSLTALDHLFRRHRLVIRHAEVVNIHGGSLRIVAGLADASEPPSGSAADLLVQEKAWGVDSLDYYYHFRSKVGLLKRTLVGLIADLKRAGRRIAAYGASAKGSTLLNYCEIGRDEIDFVADRSTVKQGRRTPGSHLPIVSPDALAAQHPDYTLLLTWNFADEILSQQQAYRSAGGRFIVPIPRVQVI